VVGDEFHMAPELCDILTPLEASMGTVEQNGRIGFVTRKAPHAYVHTVCRRMLLPVS
jgi:hypothetical protein